MAENSQNSTSVLAFIVGGLVVAIAVVAYFMSGNMPGFTDRSTGTDINVEVTAPPAAAADPAAKPAEPAAPAPAGN